MDPLSVLREHTANNKPKREVTNDRGSFIIFGDVAYPKGALTSLFQYGKNTSFYSLETLLFLWENRALPHANYVKNASGAGIIAVTRADRREIVDYLQGKRTELPSNHDAFAPLASTVPMSMFADLEGPDRKKIKLDSGAAKPARIDHLLNDGPSMAPVAEPNEIRDLNETLTADKIAALRQKRKNNQRKNVTSTIEEPEIAMETDAISAAASHDHRERGERVWRRRDNCMEAAAKTKGFEGILNTLAALKTRDEALKKVAAGGTLPSQTAPSSAARSAAEAARDNAAARGRSNYSRYDQERFNTGEESEFNIESTSTFVGKNLSFLAKEGGGGASATPRTPHAPAPSSSSSRPGFPSSTPMRTIQSHATPDSGRSHKRVSRTPIIIIPAANSSLITMFNVQDILQIAFDSSCDDVVQNEQHIQTVPGPSLMMLDMRYVTAEEKKAAGARRENECLIHRKKNDGAGGTITIPYRVIDNPMRLTGDEWDRVVAVFAMGPAWQFKNWRWSGNPVDIFANTAAFHITYDDMKLDQNIAKWSVTVIPLNRTKRHLDKARLVKFWEVLDRHVAKHRPHLRT